MKLFATPDFGASGSMMCFLMVVWAIVLTLVGIGVIRGMRLAQSGSPKTRRHGVLLLLLCAAVPLSCCLGPSQVVRVFYGNYPIGHSPDDTIKEGMTADEVLGILGPPHERVEQDNEQRWYYWKDSVSI
jgi:hypothetical protein